MNQAAQPNPAQVPTLTEVIELLSPTPVHEDGLHSPARPTPPAPGSPAAAPIVTRGLSANPAAHPDERSDGRSAWAPMSTVVLPTQVQQPGPAVVPPLADLPVLDAVVPEALAMRATKPAPQADAPLAQRPVQATLIPTVTDEVKPVEPVAAPALAPVLPEISEAQLAQRVMGDVQRQIDGMLDFRLREAIGPVLARHTEALVKDLREELNRTMRDVVTRSVAQEMAKLRQR
ncbi:MAG: hypothetical protein HYX44_03465 [Aquabacterium sp.]|nr:hypothetical protein [Aquabacterium sp.]